MEKPVVIILMGSESDLPHVGKIVSVLDEFEIESDQRIASAHKTPETLLEILKEYEATLQPKVYITVAGRSNALSGMVDASVSSPVIACPPPSSNFGGADIYSSLRMPSGVAPLVVLEPANDALAAAKILGVHSSGIKQAVQKFQEMHRNRLYAADKNLREEMNND